MAKQADMIWAIDDGGATRELVDATAREQALGVRCCTLQDLDTTTREEDPRLIGIETGAEPTRALTLVAELHRRLPQTAILLAALDGSVGFIRKALEAGASDVLSLPLGA